MQKITCEMRPLPRFEGFAPKISRLRGFVSEVRGADDQLLPAGDRIRRRFQLIAYRGILHKRPETGNILLVEEILHQLVLQVPGGAGFQPSTVCCPKV